MQEQKAAHKRLKDDIRMQHKMEEQNNRARISNMKMVSKRQIESAKKSKFDFNKHQQNEIRAQQVKIKETINKSKSDTIQHKQAAFRHAYELK